MSIYLGNENQASPNDGLATDLDAGEVGAERERRRDTDLPSQHLQRGGSVSATADGDVKLDISTGSLFYVRFPKKILEGELRPFCILYYSLKSVTFVSTEEKPLIGKWNKKKKEMMKK